MLVKHYGIMVILAYYVMLGVTITLRNCNELKRKKERFTFVLAGFLSRNPPPLMVEAWRRKKRERMRFRSQNGKK